MAVAPDPEAWLEGAGNICVSVEESLSIGRASSNGLVLPTKGISRCHAIIHARSGGEYWLVDLGSRNGTWHNGRRMMQPVRLREGDRITVGPQELTFHKEGGVDRSLRTQMSSTLALTETRELPFWLLITDIENFTGLSQKLPGQELAELVGSWLDSCRLAVEASGGRINKFLGDGFFAVWEDLARSEKQVLDAVDALSAISAKGEPAFRTVVHRGSVSVGGSPLLAEESFIGAEVNFIFRMEKAAGALAVPRLYSEAAANRLSALTPLKTLPAQSIKGFEGRFSFFVPDEEAVAGKA